MNRARMATAVAALGLAAGTLATAAPAATATSATAVAAATDRSEVSVASVRGTVHGGHSIWEKVNPFQNKIGVTYEDDTILASCKRWGADDKWWYWVRFDVDGVKGHVSHDATNITHSHLPKCG
ncbi:hypothetical protein [Streptomyces buecherae]|uniref:hypothetical protein n=1 Tax=Streptomyces buecherae TaxID=2763006 RepID=UPI001C263D3C|nr:hypothetical protein [Streptomyces buecherae]